MAQVHRRPLDFACRFRLEFFKQPPNFVFRERLLVVRQKHEPANAAGSSENSMPLFVDAVEANVTFCEISDEIRKVFSLYRETITVCLELQDCESRSQRYQCDLLETHPGLDAIAHVGPTRDPVFE